MNKIPCASQYMEAKALPADVCIFGHFWTAFICYCPLSWLPIWLWSEVVDPCFIHCHIFSQKLHFKQRSESLTLLIDCEQIWHPLRAQLFDWQMFMQNGEYIVSWYFQLLCSVMQLQFMIGQNKFVEFFSIFWDNLSIQHHLCLYDRI